MIDERKEKVISLILQGTNKSDIAKILKISRSTLYDWLKDSDLINQMKLQRNELIECGNERLTNRLDTYLDILHKIATTSKDSRTQASVSMYLTDRILGKTATHIMTNEREKDKDVVPLDVLAAELDEFEREDELEKLN